MLEADSIRFTDSPTEGLFDAVISAGGLTEANRRQLSGAAFLRLDATVAEYAVATRIGEIEFEQLATASTGDDPLSKFGALPETLD